MKFTRLSSIMMVAAIMAVVAVSAFGQENETPAAPASEPAAAVPQPASQAKELSIYGEVQSVDTQANSMKVQYYDYDADDEKTAEVIVNSETKLENANALADVKKTDWVDVTYTVSEGKNVARLVAVEREEEAPAAPVTPAPQTDMSDE